MEEGRQTHRQAGKQALGETDRQATDLPPPTWELTQTRDKYPAHGWYILTICWFIVHTVYQPPPPPPHPPPALSPKHSHTHTHNTHTHIRGKDIYRYTLVPNHQLHTHTHTHTHTWPRLNSRNTVTHTKIGGSSGFHGQELTNRVTAESPAQPANLTMISQMISVMPCASDGPTNMMN